MKTRDIYSDLIEKITGYKYFKDLTRLLDEGARTISIKNLAGSLNSLTMAALHKFKQKNIFSIFSDVNIAEQNYNDLKVILGDEKVVYIGEPARKIRRRYDNNYEDSKWQLEGAIQLAKSDAAICITTGEIFNISLPPLKFINNYNQRISIGDSVKMDDFLMNLLLEGFERVEYVSKPGEMAVRGGIVDIYPVGFDNPIRIEFLSDEIESIRRFDSISQRSIERMNIVEFTAKVFHDENEFEHANIADYIREGTIVVLYEPDKILAENANEMLINKFTNVKINGIGHADIEIKSIPQPAFNSSIQNLGAELKMITGNEYTIPEYLFRVWNSEDKRIFHDSGEHRLEGIATMAYDNNKVDIYIAADGDIHISRIRDLVENYFYDETEVTVAHAMQELRKTGLSHLKGWNDDEIYYKQSKILERIKWIDESLSQGFYLSENNLFYLTEHQIFNRLQLSKSRRRESRQGLTLKQLRQLQIGDFIVHEDKGIGLFDGFRTIELGTSLQDCVRIRYADGDNLYISLNYIHKIQPYTATEGVMPKITKLGSGEWLRKKRRTKSRLKDIARDLIKLYAERKMQAGISYPADTIWQKELEASFIYEDTPDQASTTKDVKSDMESNSPMDRLVCGDVGFGKTEIAIRAAFKAAQAGKQVAVLVPTTILAQQHYMTFTDRLKSYPVITEILSRFKNKSEQKIILEKLEDGGIDIIIGTHRLLSEDIKFRDLGLLIIDEEHRFGVGAKEKLRQLRSNVDTLTLTATPIPRTLNFSLIGARDISNIETPPRNRIPVYTEILEWNLESIKNFITKEISRGGQIFFVNDKIEGLDKISRDIKMMIPNLRIGIAHGQMRTSELESVMSKFISGRYDLLVTTKIIESGIDIPNTNTMIINNADNFGLAELYQLRGRVGRANIQAYCYLIIPPIKTLSSKSLKRLQAIEEFTELGSGFRLALRDLELRGAGNLLGPEQSGYINEIGFDLYHNILNEALQELRLEEFNQLFDVEEYKRNAAVKNDDVEISLPGTALFPDTYIKSESERFHYYKRLYDIRTNEELQDIIDEITDKYGMMPIEAKELMFAVKVRIAALNTGIRKISMTRGKLIAELPTSDNVEFYEMTFPIIIEFINDNPLCKLKQTKKKVLMEILVESRDQAIEFLWKLKKTISIS